MFRFSVSCQCLIQPLVKSNIQIVTKGVKNTILTTFGSVVNRFVFSYERAEIMNIPVIDSRITHKKIIKKGNDNYEA